MTTVVLEGDGLEELLARVSSEHGEGARVVRAERVRVGGVGGFFARQRYEVVVEVDDDGGVDGGGPEGASRPADGPPAGVKVLAGGAEDTGEGPGEDVGRDRHESTTQDAPGASADQHQHGHHGRDHEETHVLGHSRSHGSATAEVPAPRSTTTPHRHEEVLGDIFDSPIARALVRGGVLDPDANAPLAGRSPRAGAFDRLVDAADAGDDAAVGNRTNGTGINGTGLNGAGINGTGINGAGINGAGINGSASSGSDDVDGPAAPRHPRGRHAAPAEPLERGRPVSTESAAFAAVLDAVRGAAEPDPDVAPAAAADGASAEDDLRGQGPEPVAAGAAVAELMALLAARHVAEAPPAPAPPAPAPPAPAPVDVAPAPTAPTAPRSQDAAPAAAPEVSEPRRAAQPLRAAAAPGDATTLCARAAAAGLPAHLLEALPADATAGDLHAVLEQLPVAPPLPGSEGDLVAVVGAPREALVVARALATRMGLGPEGVLVAACPSGPGSPRREVVRDAVAARRAAATVRLGDAPGVVVVQVECDPESVRWARGVVSALQADQVHAVVDATRKSADTERWLDGVFAEDPEAAHVVQAAGSADPGTVLGLELPVASLDGGDGGASAWTSLLTRPLPEAPAAEPAPRRRRSAR